MTLADVAPLPHADLAADSTPPAPESVPDAVSFDCHDAQAMGVVVLAILATVFSLYFGRGILLPIVLAAVLNFLLQPLMGLLNERLRLPMPVAALLVIAAVFAIIVGLAYAFSVATSDWAQNVPQSIAVLKQKLAFLSGPLSYVQEMLYSIEHMGAPSGQPAAPVAVAEGNALPGILLFGTASTLSAFFTTITILYFMLASGDRLLRALIEVLPRFADKRRAVEIAGQVQSSIANYLMTVTVMNAAVATMTGLAMWASGLGNAVLWGAIAFLLNFVPIIGPLIGIVIFFGAGLVALPWPFPALAPPLLYTLIHFAEGQAITPLLLARRFELNPVLVILSLFFWYAIWGVPGALLAVPLLAIFKILADRIEPLKAVGHLIGA